MSELGRLSLLLAFGCAVFAVGSIAYGLRSGLSGPLRSGRRAVWTVCGLALLAVILLERALLARDMSYRYVAEHTSKDLPLHYAFTSLWAGQEGSLLLWLLILSAYGSAFLFAYRKRLDPFYDAVAMVVASVMVFFTTLLTFICSPFRILATPPADGMGLNPLLQDPGMMIHPPILYTGYVGFIIPFGFAIAVLITNRSGTRWIEEVRRWTLFCWSFLGVGILLGARWAYIELGWGGYWGWDPVENASLMPWLVGTAFLHSVMIEQRRGMLKTWNIVLIVLTFELSIFGTFLTRSGVVSSIHSFSQSPIGGWFLGFIVVCVVFSVGLIYLRLPLLRARTKLESLVSREATFLYNNLLLVAFCLTILWGVTYPLLTEALRGETRSVSKPYYNFFLHSFGLPLLLLMGIGPLVAWRRASLRALGRMFLIPLGVAAVTGVALIAAGFGSSPPGLLAYTFSAFVLASIVLEFVRGRRATGSLIRLVGKNRRRYGGYLVHAAIVLLAIGIAGSSAYQTVRERGLKPGQSMIIAGNTLTYRGLETKQESNAIATRAIVDVSRGGSHVTTLHPGKNTYPVEKQTSNEVSIYHDPRNLGDLFLIADQIDPGSNVLYLKALVKPLVNLIWAAGFLFVFGALVAMWPDAVEQRRLAERYAPGAVAA
jgi:cytochrome c-type biogenesis protein CcmF